MFAGTNQGYLLNIPMEGIKVEPRDKAPSPYGGQMFETVSPAHNVSPQYVGATPPPGDVLFNQAVLPPIEILNWNMPSTSVANPININWNVTPQNDLSAVNLESATGVTSFLNLDSHQMELKPIDLNSGDLSMLETNNLSETFTQNLSLTDIGGRADQNMTDSLTRLANCAFEKIGHNPPQ
ncbi:hypothetical protein Zmor_009735 [Zophobas morio]|uniref:Uncharacterized protein n=1 Tax=Zophobas morio TaxID=2755281 RepID=A0AA38IJM8_9CUCU|nr:hypothetical protein Zmor_009735 [Zophobas morio]